MGWGLRDAPMGGTDNIRQRDGSKLFAFEQDLSYRNAFG
jgi:hypothetical protein